LNLSTTTHVNSNVGLHDCRATSFHAVSGPSDGLGRSTVSSSFPEVRGNGGLALFSHSPSNSSEELV
jgi:hypothetical protein